MFKKARLRLTILVVFLTCAIGFIGFNTYRKLSSVLEQTGTLMIPRNYRVELQQLRSALSDADSRVRSFRLTQDVSFIKRYHQSLSECVVLLDTLYSYPQDSSQLILLDSLQQILSQKETVMRAIMELENSEEVTTELGVISRTLTSAKPDNSSHSESKKPFWKSLGTLFKPKKASHDSLLQLKSQVMKGVKTVKQNQVTRLQKQKREEFLLLAEDSRLEQCFDEILLQLEQKEEVRVKQNIQLAHENTTTVRTFNIIFAVSLTLILAGIGLVIISFIHRNQQYTEAIEKTKEEALSLAKTKETFLANMSHEIRTPLTAIVGFSEQVSEHPTSENIQRYLPVIGRSAKFLHNIVNDILDYSKITANKMTFTQQPLQLSEFVAELTALFGPQFKDKNIGLHFVLHPEKPSTITTDTIRLKQVLINLLSNSLKYTLQGSVTVTFSLNTSGSLECSVSDTGQGIEPERLPHVFEEFEQARAGEHFKRGSTGLGLSICKKLIELQGGTITLTSVVNKGTTIHFMLPVQLGNVTADAQSSMQFSFSGKKILIADDEPFNRQLLQYILQKHQVRCSVFASARDALSAIQHESFDVLLIDYRMPEMNGLELIACAAGIETNKKTPFILLTAETSAETQQLTNQYGEAVLLAKPFTENELLTKLAQHLHPTITSNVQDDTTANVNFASLKTIAGQHPEMYRDLLNTFIRSTEKGLEAMTIAADKGDLQTLREWAHKLAPASRHMGADRLVSLLKKIETTTEISPKMIENIQAEAERTFVAVKKELESL